MVILLFGTDQGFAVVCTVLILHLLHDSDMEQFDSLHSHTNLATLEPIDTISALRFK